MGELLALQGVSKSYRRGGRRLRVLTDVSLELQLGEIGAIVGARDEGKTTLLKIAAGIEPPDTGEVRLGTRDLTLMGREERARLLGGEIAWIHREGPGVRLEVLDYLGLPLALGRGRGRREAREQVQRALDRVGAGRCARQRWEELSDWERAILSLIGQGLNDDEIGERLNLSPRTVQTHRSNILRKLDLKGTPKLIAFAIEHGFTQVPNFVLTQKELSVGAKLAYAMLLKY
ncbi:MAG: LuxR C-terminal-related transcriptional regulator, partial [Solirubrobacteraceae bacterium]